MRILLFAKDFDAFRNFSALIGQHLIYSSGEMMFPNPNDTTEMPNLDYKNCAASFGIEENIELIKMFYAVVEKEPRFVSNQIKKW